MSERSRSRWGVWAGVAAALVLGGVRPALADGGGLDGSFGIGGVVVSAANNNYAPGVALAPDAKLVVVGARGLPPSSTGSRSEWLIRRFTTNGSLDPSFGVGGEVALFGAGPDGARRVAVDGQGRILVVGTVTTYTTSRRSVVATSALTVVRLTALGSLDSTFGGTGVVKIAPPGALANGGAMPAGCVLAQADGRIVVAAAASYAVDKRTTRARPFLVRLLDDGVPDTSFGASGYSVETRLGQDAGVISLARQASGHYALAQRGTTAWIVTRHLPHGGVDAAFLPDMRAGSYIGGIAIDGSDRILVSGRNTLDQGKFDLEVVRYDATGVPDVSFGVSGVARIHLLDQQNTWSDPVVDPLDGGILLATNLVSIGAVCAPVRLRTDGSLDVAWGSGGVGQHVSGNATGLAQQADGRLVLAGQVSSTSGWSWVLARYAP